MSWFIEYAEPNKAAALERLDAEVHRAKPPQSVVEFLAEAIGGCHDKTIYVRSTGHLGAAGSIYDRVNQTQTTEVRNL